MRTAIVTAVIAAVIGVILLFGASDPAGPNGPIVIGLLTGTAYGLVSIGLVLVYKGARVFNFAQGEFGTLAGFITYVLIEQVSSPDIPYWLAALIAVAAVVLIGLGMERVVVRPLLSAPRITLLVATIAFALLCIGVQIMLFLPEAKDLPRIIEPLNAAGTPVGPEVAGFIIEPQLLLIVAVLLALAVILGYFFSKTDLGLAILATSQDAFATRVVGIGVERVSRFIWGSAAFLGAVAGILYIPPSLPLTPGVMTAGVLIASFTAAVIGGMTSLPGAFLGGITVGVIQQLAGWAGGNYQIGERFIQDIVPGSANVAVLVVLLLVLLIRPQGLLGREA
jgi:branched-chain amino acid transport system permease protein